MRVMEWNVENLFDCRHDTLKNDYEFLPESDRRWTWGRYWQKLDDLGRVVMAVGGDSPPSLVGLCEIENDTCMRDLTQRSVLRSLGYRYVMTDSPDSRGMDVALMYLPQNFRLLGSEARRVPSEAAGLYPTRDLLHVWGVLPSGDTLHVAVCHLPSRTQGRKGDKNRKLAAETLAALIDSLGQDCRLLVMGDFNAAPHDPVFKVLRSLVDLAPQGRHPSEGTYRYRGDWSWIDHMLASRNLLPFISALSLYTAPWLQDSDSNGGWHPRRTYTGPAYHGGVSDHVPIYCDYYYQPR